VRFGAAVATAGAALYVDGVMDWKLEAVEYAPAFDPEMVTR
jgi:hypothetical protein